MDAADTLVVRLAGRVATVRRSSGHPDQYLYLETEGRTYFLAVLEPGMTRGDVRRMALAWLAHHSGSG